MSRKTSLGAFVAICVLLMATMAIAQGADLDQARSHYQVGLKALNNNDLKVAREEFAEAARLTPNNALIWFNLAIVQLKLNEATGAQASLKRAVDLGLPKDMQAQVEELRASILYEERRSGRERAELLSALRTHISKSSLDPGWSSYDLTFSGCEATLITVEQMRWSRDAPSKMARSTLINRVEDTFKLQDLDREATVPRNFAGGGRSIWLVMLRGVRNENAIVGRLSEYLDGRNQTVYSNKEWGGRKFPSVSSDEMIASGEFNATAIGFTTEDQAQRAAELFKRAIAMCSKP